MLYPSAHERHKPPDQQIDDPLVAQIRVGADTLAKLLDRRTQQAFAEDPRVFSAEKVVELEQCVEPRLERPIAGRRDVEVEGRDVRVIDRFPRVDRVRSFVAKENCSDDRSGVSDSMAISRIAASLRPASLDFNASMCAKYRL